MKSKGKVYSGTLQYWHKKVLPVIEVGTTQETEYPFRGGKCFVFRIPKTKTGYFLGIWVKKSNIHPDDDIAIDQLLAEAMRGRKAWSPEDGIYNDFFKD